MLYWTSRSVPPQPASSTPQSEASSSNHQSQKDQEMQSRNSSDGLVPLPLNADGAVGSGTSTRDLENSLQKAQENFIKSQIEVRKNLDPESTLFFWTRDSKGTQLTSFHAALWCNQQVLHTSYIASCNIIDMHLWLRNIQHGCIASEYHNRVGLVSV
jgi:hypothetical protein